MTNKAGFSVMGFGGEVGQEQRVFGETLSSDYKSFTKGSASFDRVSSRVVEETDSFGNTTIKQETGYKYEFKFIIGIAIKIQLEQ